MNDNPYQSPNESGPSRKYDGWLVVYVVLALVQFSLVVIQRIELALYDSHISDHMPSMGEPDKFDWVTFQFNWLAILIPIFSQLILIPALLIGVSLTKLSSRVILTSYIATTLFALFAWYNSVLAIANTIATFD